MAVLLTGSLSEDSEGCGVEGWLAVCGFSRGGVVVVDITRVQDVVKSFVV